MRYECVREYLCADEERREREKREGEKREGVWSELGVEDGCGCMGVGAASRDNPRVG